MATFDQMIIDDRDLANRYFGDSNLDNLDDDQYLFSKSSTTNQQPFSLHLDHPNDSANNSLFGRRVFLESPSLGNKEDEELYRYVPSRLSDHATAVLGPTAPAQTGDTLIDSLDFELDLLGATNTRPVIPYRTNDQLFNEPKPPASLTQLTNPLTPMTNMRRADPRQDPLLGPLLAELDAMSTQQQRLTQAQPPAPPIPAYRRNSVPYEQNRSRPSVLDQTNNALTTTNHRTANNNSLNNDLYDSLEPREQQQQRQQSIPSSIPNINQLHQQQQQPPQQQQQQQHQLPNRRSNMNSTDIFMPLSYNDGPSSFLNNFGADDQLFQQPLFNAIGQNYVSNTRPPLPPPPRQEQQQQSQFDQRNGTFDQSYARISPPPRSTYAPSNNNINNNNNSQQQQQPFSNRQPAYNNNNDNDPFSEFHDMFGPSQYSRAPPVQPQQQRIVPQPPPSQSQQQQQSYRRPLPPSSQQNQYQRPPSSSQYDRQNYNQDPYNSNYESNNQEMFFTDHNDDQLDQFPDQQQQHLPPMSQRNADQQMDQDSRRQAVWNELQRTNAKVQEKNAKKRESANRREQLLKGNYGSNTSWNQNNSQQSSAKAKIDTRSPPQRRPPPIPVSKTNYIEDNVDMIKNKENFYHRYPAKKYENLYSKRKDLAGEGNSDKKREQTQNTRTEFDQNQTVSFNNPEATYSDTQHRSSLPVTINLNPDNNNSQRANLPGSITIPLDSQVTREGDKISVNIDLRLVDLQNLKQQQQQNSDHPDWSGLDPLDRHIRKLERSLDQSLPQTYSPTQQRSPTFSNPSMNASMGRYGKNTTAAGRGGYSPPNYRSEQYQYNYSDKGQEENSYLAKMNHGKKGPHFKPYTGQDYEQFKKNYGFGTGYLGFDFDNPNYKEKSDKLTKTKEYAQQVEVRNKKKLAEAPRRTLSDTRIPTESSKTQRALEYARVSTRHKPQSGPTTRPFPSDMNDNAHQGGRRPTEVVNRPPPAIQKQPTRLAQHDDNELVERLALRHERDKAQVQGILNPSQKRRDQLFNDDDRRGSDIERLAQERVNQRRYSPPKQGPPSGPTNNSNARRPLRFDKPLVPDESSYTPPHPQDSQQQQQQQQQQFRPVQQRDHQPTPPRHNSQHYDQQQYQQQSQTHVDELANRHNDEKMLMEAIRQELSERPLGDDEELIVVEQ